MKRKLLGCPFSQAADPRGDIKAAVCIRMWLLKNPANLWWNWPRRRQTASKSRAPLHLTNPAVISCRCHQRLHTEHPRKVHPICLETPFLTSSVHRILSAHASSMGGVNGCNWRRRGCVLPASPLLSVYARLHLWDQSSFLVPVILHHFHPAAPLLDQPTTASVGFSALVSEDHFPHQETHL